MSPKLRLIDIAKKANVSLGTVDRVVNNRGKAAQKTEKLIREIIEEFGYEPNLRASSLSSKKRIKFAVLVPKPQGEDYWNKLLSGVRTADKMVSEFGVEVTEFLFDQDDDLMFLELCNQVIEIQFDGVLLVPVFQKESNEFIQRLEQKKIPYVFIDSMIEGASPLCSISQNNFQSGLLAAKLLNYCIQSGDELLLISPLSNTGNFDHMQERSYGFKSFFKAEMHEKTIIHTIEIVNPRFENLAAVLDEKLIQYPNIKGIFINNSKAYQIARYLNENIILTVKIVGFDLIDQNIKYLQSGIIEFILFDYAEKQGGMGIQILFDYLVKKQETVKRINMPINIVTKENLDGFLA